MAKLLFVRLPLDEKEAGQIRKLVDSQDAPGDWIIRARMIVRSQEGKRTTVVADKPGPHPHTVNEVHSCFDAEGIDGLGGRSGV